MQLWPLYALAGVFGLYTLRGIVVYLWDQSTRQSAEDYIKEMRDRNNV